MPQQETEHHSISPSVTIVDFDLELDSRLCAGCSCLCDDISLYFNRGKLVRTLNLCEVGWQKLSTVFAEGRVPRLTDQQQAGAITKAAKLLASQKPALILGADSLGGNAILESWNLARALNGIWLPWSFSGAKLFYDQVREQGWATALLDEVRDQADTVIFWRADPLITHHRHLSRYSVFAHGRFTERGNHDRNLAAINTEKTIIEPLCQQTFQIPPETDAAFIDALANPSPQNEFHHRDFPLLARALQRGIYVALFVDPEKTHRETFRAMFQWADQVNASGRQRLVILPLWDSGANMDGFCQLSLEKNNTGWGADFSSNFTPAGITETDLNQLADAVGSVMVFETHPDCGQGSRLPEVLADKPKIIIDPFKQAHLQDADVYIPAALSGVEVSDLFFRSDGLPLKASALEPFANAGYPLVEDILQKISVEITRQSETK